MGMGAVMRTMERLNELEEERIKGLESCLQGREKIEYERLKEEVERKNKNTWRKAQLVGATGILTIVSSFCFTLRGLGETRERLDNLTVVQKDSQYKGSFQTYGENRSPFLDYAWLGIIIGNAICGAGFIAGQHIMERRSTPLRDYL